MVENQACVRNHSTCGRNITPDELDFLPLKVTHIDEGARRCFERRDTNEAAENSGTFAAGV
ncbi:hypothetical protein [Paraburkholderia hospita]|jgi:transposase|uniref:hypothetical protein n=1 Tax=Paraburkholderia hospita TaxID=169430 RepID=UPI001591658D|nr:hypothetical protein [Paraburkholderia hospita]